MDAEQGKRIVPTAVMPEWSRTTADELAVVVGKMPADRRLWQENF